MQNIYNFRVPIDFMLRVCTVYVYLFVLKKKLLFYSLRNQSFTADCKISCYEQNPLCCNT